MGRRLHILLDDERYGRVAATAHRRGVSVAAVIREAIDRGLPAAADATREAALRTIFAAQAMDVPHDPTDLRAELDAAHGKRA
jgi:uncharacterized membrane protein